MVNNTIAVLHMRPKRQTLNGINLDYSFIIFGGGHGSPPFRKVSNKRTKRAIG